MAQRVLLDDSNMLDVKVEDDLYQVYYGFHRFASFHKGISINGHYEHAFPFL